MLSVVPRPLARHTVGRKTLDRLFPKELNHLSGKSIHYYEMIYHGKVVTQRRPD